MEGIDLALTALRDGAPWYAGAAAATMVAIRLFRHPGIQDGLPPLLKWNRLPKLVRRVLVALASGATSWLAAVAAGQPSKQALLATLPVMVAAVVGHKTTKAIGHAQTKQALAREGHTYKPSAARAAVSPVIPIDHARIDIHNRLHRQHGWADV